MANLPTLKTSMDMDNTKFNAKIKSSKSVMADFGKKMEDIGKKAKWVFAGVGAAITGAGYAYSEYDKHARETWTLLDVGKTKFNQFSDAISKMSTKVPYTGSQLQQALYQLVSSGYSLDDSMKMLPTAAKAATAGVSDVFTAVDLGTSIMLAYKRPASEFEHTFDELFTTVKLGRITFKDLGSYMGQVTGIAANMHIPLADLLTSITIMTKTLKPSQVMTSLTAAISSIEHPTSDAIKEMKKYGLSFKDAQGNMKSFGAIAKELAANPDAKLGSLFNVEALKGMTTLVANADQYNGIAKQIVKSTNATSKAYDKMAGGLWFQLTLLKNTFLTFAEEIGKAFEPEIRGITEWLKGVLEFSKKNVGFVKTILEVVLAISGALVGLGVIATISRWISSISLSLPILLPILIAIGSSSALLALNFKDVSEFAKEAGNWVSDMWVNLQKSAAAHGGGLGGWIQAIFEGLWNGLKSLGSIIWNWISSNMPKVWGYILDGVKNLTVFIVSTVIDKFGGVFGWVKDKSKNVFDAIRAASDKAIGYKEPGAGVKSQKELWDEYQMSKGAQQLIQGNPYSVWDPRHWLWKGHEEGGYTAQGAPNQVAGVVHAGEYVIPQWMVNKNPQMVQSLEAQRVKGYQAGGFTISTPVPDLPSYAHTTAPMTSTTVAEYSDSFSKILDIIKGILKAFGESFTSVKRESKKMADITHVIDDSMTSTKVSIKPVSIPELMTKEFKISPSDIKSLTKNIFSPLAHITEPMTSTNTQKAIIDSAKEFNNKLQNSLGINVSPSKRLNPTVNEFTIPKAQLKSLQDNITSPLPTAPMTPVNIQKSLESNVKSDVAKLVNSFYSEMRKGIPSPANFNPEKNMDVSVHIPKKDLVELSKNITSPLAQITAPMTSTNTQKTIDSQVSEAVKKEVIPLLNEVYALEMNGQKFSANISPLFEKTHVNLGESLPSIPGHDVTAKFSNQNIDEYLNSRLGGLDKDLLNITKSMTSTTPILDVVKSTTAKASKTIKNAGEVPILNVIRSTVAKASEMINNTGKVPTKIIEEIKKATGKIEKTPEVVGEVTKSISTVNGEAEKTVKVNDKVVSTSKKVTKAQQFMNDEWDKLVKAILDYNPEPPPKGAIDWSSLIPSLSGTNLGASVLEWKNFIDDIKTWSKVGSQIGAGMFNDMVKSFTGIWDFFTQKNEEGSTKFETTVSTMFNNIPKFTSRILKFFSPDNLAKTGKDIGDFFGKTDKKGQTGFSTAIGGLISNIIPTIMAGGKAIASAFGAIIGALGGMLASILPTISVMEIFKTASSFLSPMINKTLKPMFNILHVIGLLIGKMLYPILEHLAPLIKILGDVALWLINNVVIPIANLFTVIANALYDAFAFSYNVISAVVSGLTFGLVNLEQLKMAKLDEGMISPISEEEMNNAGEPSGGGNTTYQAGSTQAITVNQTFVLNTGAFTGDESSAEEFIKFVFSKGKEYGYIGG